MQCLRIYADETGESHLVDIDIPLVPTEVFPGVPAPDFSDQYTATSVRFAWVPAGVRVAAWHTTPVRQLVVWLTGWVEFETSDGETRRWVAAVRRSIVRVSPRPVTCPSMPLIRIPLKGSVKVPPTRVAVLLICGAPSVPPKSASSFMRPVKSWPWSAAFASAASAWPEVRSAMGPANRQGTRPVARNPAAAPALTLASSVA